jgi:hypothetical protein
MCIRQFCEICRQGCSSYHNKEVPTCVLYVDVKVSLLATTSLPFLDLDHDTPLKTLGDVVKYIILWHCVNHGL